MTALLYVSLAVNYVFGMLLTLLWLSDKTLSDDSLAFLSLMWPIGIPLVIMHGLVRRRSKRSGDAR